MKRKFYYKKTIKERSKELDRCCIEINKALLGAGFRLCQVEWVDEKSDVLKLSCWRKS